MTIALGAMPVLSGRGSADPEAIAGLVRLLEELGCDSVWAVEHIVIVDSYTSSYPYDPTGKMSLLPGDDVPDPLHWLTFAAAHTSTLRLGSAMLILPEHNPVILAKRLATVDVLSGGRLLAGIGVGWQEEEYDAVGVPFAARGHRADEYLAAMTALWTQAPASYSGETVRFSNVHSEPKPVRAGGVPIIVGGHSAAAVRRAARFGSGLYPLGVDLDGMRGLVDRLALECAAIGRDPAEIELTARAPGRREVVRALADMGVRRVVMRVPFDDLAQVRADVSRYQREVL